MNNFGTQTNYSLDKSKPYQRPELRHAGLVTSANQRLLDKLKTPSRIACSDLLDSVVINEINLASVYEGSTHHLKNNHTKQKTQ
jgi:hypothetical protein